MNKMSNLAISSQAVSQMPHQARVQLNGILLREVLDNVFFNAIYIFQDNTGKLYVEVQQKHLQMAQIYLGDRVTIDGRIVKATRALGVNYQTQTNAVLRKPSDVDDSLIIQVLHIQKN